MSKSRKQFVARQMIRAAIDPLESRMLLSAALLGDSFNYPVGNFNNAGLSLNGGAVLSNPQLATRLQLSDGGAGESRSAFTTKTVNASAFTTDFSFQITNAATNGLAFVIQGSSATAVGSSGGDGFGNLGSSVALGFQTTSTASQAVLGTNGTAGAPTDLAAAGIDLHSGHIFNVHVEYDGSTLKVTETDASTLTAATPVSATQVYSNVNIPGIVGASAFAGFTGGTTTAGATQEVLNWEFANVKPTDSNIGAASTAGSSTYSIGSYGVTGAGTGIGSTSDQIHFLSKAQTGDSTIISQMTSAPSATSGAIEGLMVRDGTSASAAFALVTLTPGGAQFIARASAGAASVAGQVVGGFGAGSWLKLVRDGNSFAGYASTTGADGSWVLVGTAGAPMATVAQVGLAVASGSSSATFTANFAATSVTQDAPIGIDTGGAGRTPQEYEQMWVDVVKQSYGFYKASNSSALAAVDATGNPTEDFIISTIMEAHPDEAGTYHLRMNVNQNPTVSTNDGAISNQTYDAVKKQFDADVAIPGNYGVVSITVTNTGGGATNVHLTRPGYDPATTQVFTTQYLNLERALHPRIIRFMNFTATNNNPVQTWAQRTLPSDPSQTQYAQIYNFDGTPSSEGSSGKGTAWEYAIELANALHTDMWINLPAQANDNYVQQLAQLIKNGDTINGVTYPALNPDLNVYVEYSNEGWNPGFDVNPWSTAAAVSEVSNGAKNGTPSNLNYDNLSLAQNSDGSYVNAHEWQKRFFARRDLQISNIFAGVFGASATNTRIRTVLSDLPSVTDQADMLSFINAVYGPPKNYFYDVATATYANMNGPANTTNQINGGNSNPNLSANDVLTNLAINGHALTDLYDRLYAVAQQYGLQMAAYESGPDLSGTEGQGANGGKALAEQDPRFTSFLEQYYQDWFAHGGGATIYYTGGVRPWGNIHGDFQITDTVTDLTNPKATGLEVDTASPRPLPAPAVPTAFHIVSVSGTSVSVAWTPQSTNETEFRVIVSTNANMGANQLQFVAPAGSSAYVINGLQPGVTYYFAVAAASDVGDSTDSNVVSGVTGGTPIAPPAPSGAAVTILSNSQAKLSWMDNSKIETGFHIDVATDANFTQIVQTVAAPTDATAQVISNLNSQTTYYFRVRAFDGFGESANAVVSGGATTQAAVPLAKYEFNEASGSTANDSGSAPLDNGSIVGGVTRVTGPDGSGALNFDGSTGYVDLGNPNKLNLQGQITVSAWIKPTSVTGKADVVAHDWDGSHTPFFLQLRDNQTVVFGTYRFQYFGNPGVFATGTSPVSLTDGNWHHVAGEYDGTQFKVYIDGVLRGQVSDMFGVTGGSQPVNIGRNSNGFEGTHAYFNGAIDDVRMYGTALGDGDIAQLATISASTAPAIPTGLQATTVAVDHVTLNWAETTPGVTFVLQRAADATFQNANTVNLPASPLNYTDQSVAQGQTYYYRIAAVGASQTSGYDVLGPVTIPTLPAAPTNFVPTTIASDHVIFGWSESSASATGFILQDSTDGINWNPAATAPAGATGATVNGLNAGTTYTFRIEATSAAGNSAFTTSGPVTTLAGATAAPTSLQTTSVASDHVTLSWSESSTITGFVLQRSTDPGFAGPTIFNLPASPLSFNDMSVQAGQSYYYRVQAIGAGAPSAFTGIGPVAVPNPVSAAIIEDVTNPAVTEAGRWWSGTFEAGYYGSQFLNDGNQGKGTKNVTFNVPLPVAGNYLLSLWNPADARNAANVPVDVITSTGKTTLLINEQQNGGAWLDLGTFAFNGSAQVIVRNDNTSGLVVADAIKLTPAPGPTAPAAPGNLSTSILTSTSVQLNWSESSVNVTGFILQQSTDGKAWNPAGTAAAGAVSAVISGLSPAASYFFRIAATSGSGNSAFAAIGPVSTSSLNAPTIIQDVTDPAVSESGRWWSGTNETGFHGSQFDNDGNQGKGTKSVTFNLPVPTPGSYAVSIWYPADARNANNVPVDIVTTAGTTRVLVNEQTGGGNWLSLGTFNFNTNAQIIVRNDNTSGLVVANAFGLAPVTGPAAPAAPANFTPMVLSPSSIQLNWTESSNNVTGFVLQQSTDGSNWTPAGTPAAGATSAVINNLSPGSSYYFRIQAVGNTVSSAFATIGPLTTTAAPAIIQDITSPAVVETGRWWAGTFEPGYFGTQFANDGNQGQGTKKLQFNVNLPTAGSYAVYTWYPAASRNAGNAPVDIATAGGTQTVLVNERQNGGAWQPLGTYQFNAGNAAVTFRNDNANGMVVANAVKFVKVG